MNFKIEELKNELETVIKDTNTCIDKVYQISSDIDEEIRKVYITKNSNIVLDKYNKYFDRNDKRQLLRQIKSDILENFDKISLNELEILSSNFYDYCCLMYNQIPINEIAQYFLDKNGYYYENLTEENKKKIFPTDDDKLASLIILSNKLYRQTKK